MSIILSHFRKWMKPCEIFAQATVYDKTTGRESQKEVSKGKFQTYVYERRSNELYRGGTFRYEQLKSTVDAVFIFDPIALRNAGVKIEDSYKINFEDRDWSVVHANNVGRLNEVTEVFVKRINNKDQ